MPIIIQWSPNLTFKASQMTLLVHKAVYFIWCAHLMMWYMSVNTEKVNIIYE